MIEVRPYTSAWAVRFEELRRLYAQALERAKTPFVAIEHVGSTSVPGLAAKPVVDIDIVASGSDVVRASQVLVSLGFEPRGEVGIPQRWAFWEPESLLGTNTYVVVEGSLAFKNHLAVRDLLRKDAGLRDEYARVKLEAGRVAADIEEYGSLKGPFIQTILASAGLSASERAFIASNNVPRGSRRRHDEDQQSG